MDKNPLQNLITLFLAGRSITHTYIILTASFHVNLGSLVCPLDSESPVILILSILTGQVKVTWYIGLYPTHLH